jgi:hypothetical protein
MENQIVKVNYSDDKYIKILNCLDTQTDLLNTLKDGIKMLIEDNVMMNDNIICANGRLNSVEEKYIIFESKITLLDFQWKHLRNEVQRKASEFCSVRPKTSFHKCTQRIHKSILHPTFGVNSYKYIREKDYEKALEIVDNITLKDIFPSDDIYTN